MLIYRFSYVNSSSFFHGETELPSYTATNFVKSEDYYAYRQLCFGEEGGEEACHGHYHKGSVQNMLLTYT